MNEQKEELGFGADVKTALRTLIETCERFADKLEAQEKEQKRVEEVQEAGPWTPKVGERYSYITDGGVVEDCRWDEDDVDIERHAIGNCFQTELEAKRHAAKMKFMFRRCPEIGESNGYMSITSLGSIATISGSNEFTRKECNHGVVFKNYQEAEEWLPLYKFAFLGGDCPEGF